MLSAGYSHAVLSRPYLTRLKQWNGLPQHVCELQCINMDMEQKKTEDEAHKTPVTHKKCHGICEMRLRMIRLCKKISREFYNQVIIYRIVLANCYGISMN